MSAMTAPRQPSNPPETLPLGQNGVLVRFAKQASADATAACLAFQKELVSLSLPEVTAIIPSLTSVLIQFDPTQTNRAALLTALAPCLQNEWSGADLPSPKRKWHIPIAFGGEYGPQLTEFSTLSGLSETQILADIETSDLRVAAIGFAPGQPYIGYLPQSWQIPRQRNLTPQVPAGAIVTAVRQMVLFTNASTTGWRHIAQTGFRPFLRDRDQPFLLQQGDALRLYRISHSDMEDLMKHDRDGIGGARLEVLT